MTNAEPRFPIRQLMPALASALRGPGSDAPTGLPWRIKQVQRQDWPTTLERDAQIKQGYTPAQTLRLLAALSLLDAGLGPTQAVGTASDNENALLGIMATAFGASAPHAPLVALIRPRTIDGPGAQNADAIAIVVEPIDTEEVAGRIALGSPGPAWLILDMATQCRAMIDSLDPGPEALKLFAAVAQEGARATLAGRGYVPAKHPRGDRYLTRGGGGRSPGR